MSSLPDYSPPQTQEDPVPPYRASHAFANSTEELAALKDFAQSKMYVDPGKDGTLPDLAACLRWTGSAQPADQAKEERRQLREMEKLKKAKEEKPRRESVSQRLKRIITHEKEPAVIR